MRKFLGNGLLLVGSVLFGLVATEIIVRALGQTPPELASDVARDGILLAGGGTLINGFPELVADETGMPVFRADSPLTCVAIGSGQALDHFDQLSASSRRRRLETTPDWRTAQ